MDATALSSVARSLQSVSVTLADVAEQISMLEGKLGISQEAQPSFEPVSEPVVSQPEPEPEPPVSYSPSRYGNPRPERQEWVWCSGETKPHARAFREAGALWSSKRQAWYFTGGMESVPQHILALPNVQMRVTR